MDTSPARNSAPSPGAVLGGRYRLDQELGRGGAGVVFRGWDLQLERPVAVKLLPADVGQVARQRFRREVAALSRLDHPHVVRVFDALSDDPSGRLALVMELVPGRPLSERLSSEGPLPLGEWLELALALTQAVGHAHAHGLLHRDLKPANVFLEPDGRVRLGDFGLSACLADDVERLTQTGQLLGTPGFWAPEQARGERTRVGPASDVYGLGALLYAAWTAAPPHGEPESLAHAVANLERPPRPPEELRPDTPAWLSAALTAALEPDPDHRLGSVAELTARIDRRPTAGVGRRAWRLSTLLLLGTAGAAGVLLSVAPLTPRPQVSPGSPPAQSAGPGMDPSTAPSTAPSSRPGQGSLDAFSRAYQLGLAFEAQGQPAEAAAAFRRAHELRPEDPQPLLRLGLALFDQGQPQAAIAALEQAVSHQPPAAIALENLGVILATEGRLTESVARLEQAVATDPKLASAWFNLSRVYRQSARPAQSLAAALRGSELDPADPRALLFQARALVALGKLPAARRYYEIFLDRHPHSVDVWTYLGDLQLVMDDDEQAESSYLRALELDPAHRGAREGLRRARRAIGPLPREGRGEGSGDANARPASGERRGSPR